MTRTHVVLRGGSAGRWEPTGRLSPCEHAFVSIKGSPYARFQRALQIGKPSLVYAAAAELPRLSLDDGLTVLVLMARHDRPRFDRAAVRWLARLAAERPLGLADLGTALAACQALPWHPDHAEEVLRSCLRGA